MASATVFAAIHIALSAGSGQRCLPGWLQYLFTAAVQNISREYQDTTEPRTSLDVPVQTSCPRKVPHWPRLKECQRYHLTTGSGRCGFSFSLKRRWVGTQLMALILKRFQLEVEKSWPCSECSQCHPPPLHPYYYLIAWVLSKHAHTKVQK